MNLTDRLGETQSCEGLSAEGPRATFRPDAVLNHIDKAATATPASTGSSGTPLEINRYDAKNAAAKK